MLYVLITNARRWLKKIVSQKTGILTIVFIIRIKLTDDLYEDP